jgi:peptidoglycan/LPS O-acetylase OafA/YrhL
MRMAGSIEHSDYRADVDGLRAVAVLAVVGFHAFPDVVRGGFIGVDVFLVISGFLITSIILGNLERFSFCDFYSRRIRRIFPALIVVLAAACIAGFFMLTADEIGQLGKHVVGAATFVSNFVVWSESGYFDSAAETKPLLHLWSLGIEEQFYIFWPFLIWALHRFRINILTTTIVVGLISFGLNALLVRVDNVAVFLAPPTRIWELLMGAVLACHVTSSSSLRGGTSVGPLTGFLRGLPGWRLAELPAARLDDGLALVGAILIAFGIAFTTNGRSYPGLQALLPTVGTALIISAGPQAKLNRLLLARRELVWIGLISYPLYLWHWPLLVFARINEGGVPSIEVRISAVVISFALAFLTYWLVERPFRFGIRRGTMTVVLVSLISSVGLTGYVYGWHREAFPGIGEFAQEIGIGDIGHDQFHKYLEDHFYHCTPENLKREALIWKGTIRCFQSQRGDRKQIAVIGDSHAEHLFIGLAEALPAKNVVYYIKNAMLRFDGPEFGNIFRYVIADDDIATVILGGAWHHRLSAAMDRAAFESDMRKVVAELISSRKILYLVEDAPAFSNDVRKCKFQRISYQGVSCDESQLIYFKQREMVRPIFSSIQRRYPDLIDLKTASYFCDHENCSMKRGNAVLFRDGHHLNILGSRFVGRKIVEDNPRIAE